MRDKPLHPVQIIAAALVALGFIYLVGRALWLSGENSPTNPPPALIADAGPAPASIVVGPVAPPPLVEHEVTIDRPLGAQLAGLGVAPGSIKELVAAFEGVLDFRRIRQGAKLTATVRTADGRLERLGYSTGPLERYEATRDTAGKLTARKLVVPVRVQVAEIGAELKVSLYQAMQRAGETSELVASLVDAFAFDIDFYKDPRPGDRFRVIVEKRYTGDTFIDYGRLLAAEYVSARHGKTFRVFWFGPNDAPWASYFDEQGQNTRKTFLKTPLKFARVSSKFDPKRKHPILKYTRAHNGTDFAAKTGTPVWAMADGVIRSADFDRGYGNVVVIAHKDGLMSFSAHLSRVAKGISRGVKVKQKQIVGYVGSTGLSTGPHLHFGVKRNGAWVDFEKLKLPRDPPVPASQMAAFRQATARLVTQLSRVAVQTAPTAEGDDPDSATDDPPEEASAPDAGAQRLAPNSVVQPPPSLP
jgi:murein DD-endopeptidase MepM/ murein hydrolase activator NlpD